MTKLGVLALACGALAVTSCAGGGRPRADAGAPQQRVLLSGDAMVFATFDSNGDLRIDSTELNAGIAREFARADENHDGSLSPLEFQTWSGAALGGANAPPYRLDFDRNVDNSITSTEFTTELQARARDYDIDHDNVLVRSEFIRELQRPPQTAPRRNPYDMREPERGSPPTVPHG